MCLLCIKSIDAWFLPLYSRCSLTPTLFGCNKSRDDPVIKTQKWKSCSWKSLYLVYLRNKSLIAEISRGIVNFEVMFKNLLYYFTWNGIWVFCGRLFFLFSFSPISHISYMFCPVTRIREDRNFRYACFVPSWKRHEWSADAHIRWLCSGD